MFLCELGFPVTKKQTLLRLPIRLVPITNVTSRITMTVTCPKCQQSIDTSWKNFFGDIICPCGSRVNNPAIEFMSRVPAGLIWIVGLALIVAWTALWLAFSSQVHTGWLAEEIRDPEHGTIAIHTMISGVMILLGWLFGLGGIGLLVSGREEKERRAERPQWMNEVAYCPKCRRKLRTSRAKQCFHCGADWH